MKKERSTDLDRQERLNLKRRYLIWLYKNTKEALDRIDRKLTQLEIDREIFNKLNNSVKIVADESNWQRLLDEFKEYIDKKEKDSESLRYCDDQGSIKADCLFLKSKLLIIEDLISDNFGKAGLRQIKSLYDKEMVKRIIEEREHR